MRLFIFFKLILYINYLQKNSKILFLKKARESISIKIIKVNFCLPRRVYSLCNSHAMHFGSCRLPVTLQVFVYIYIEESLQWRRRHPLSSREIHQIHLVELPLSGANLSRAAVCVCGTCLMKNYQSCVPPELRASNSRHILNNAL